MKSGGYIRRGRGNKRARTRTCEGELRRGERVEIVVSGVGDGGGVRGMVPGENEGAGGRGVEDTEGFWDRGTGEEVNFPCCTCFGRVMVSDFDNVGAVREAVF